MKILLTFFLLFSTSVFAKNVAFVNKFAKDGDWIYHYENHSSIEAKWVYFNSEPPSDEQVYFTEEAEIGVVSIYIDSDCSNTDVEVVSGTPNNAEWIYIYDAPHVADKWISIYRTDGPTTSNTNIRAEGIYLTSSSSSADYTVCFPSSFEIFREHIAAIYILYLK